MKERMMQIVRMVMAMLSTRPVPLDPPVEAQAVVRPIASVPDDVLAVYP